MTKIQRLRMEKGLKRKDVSEALGITRRAAEALEHRGANGLHAEKAVRLADLLECEVRDLLD